MRRIVVLAVAAALTVMAFGARAAEEDASQGDGSQGGASQSYDASTEGASATVTAQRGTTEVLRLDAENWENTEVGGLYSGGSEFKTGARSYIEVALDEDNSFRIKSATRVKVAKIFDAAEDAAGNVVRIVELQVVDGEVNARLRRLPDDVRVRVASPTAVAGATGTGFTFAYNQAELAALVKVTESAVLVQALDRADKSVTVHAFEQVEAREWKGGKLTANGHGVLSNKVLGTEFVDQFRQPPGDLVVTAAATAPAPDGLTDQAERRAESKQAALDAARTALSALVMQLAVNETTTVADLVAANRLRAARIYEILNDASVLDTSFAEDDSCTVTLQLRVAAVAAALGRGLPATIASVGEMPKADYLAKFGAEALASTERTAETDAKRRLAAKINSSIVAPGRTLQDEADRNAGVRATILRVVEGAIVENEHYFSDGSVTVLMSCMLGQIAENHPELVGDTYLSSPEPALFDDFMDYRFMRERARVPGGAGGGQEAAQGKKTQGQLAKDIVRMLGLENKMPPNATELDYIAFLRDQGLSPLPDWNPGGEATEEVIAVLMIKMLGWGSEVGNPGDPGDYLALLRLRGLNLGNVRDILGNTNFNGPLMPLVPWDPLAGPYQDNVTSVRGR